MSNAEVNQKIRETIHRSRGFTPLPGMSASRKSVNDDIRRRSQRGIITTNLEGAITHVEGRPVKDKE